MAGQLWGTANLGGYMYSDKLSAMLRRELQPMVKFRQFSDVKDAGAQGKKKGDTFNWNVYSNVATQGTTLTEGTPIPQTNFLIGRGSLTITEAGNSVPYTEKLDNLSEHSVTEVIDGTLKDDAKKAFDILAHAQFNQTGLRVAPTGGTSATAITLEVTAGTASTITNDVAMSKEHVKAISDTMRERNIPAMIADDYVSIAHISTFRPFKNELETIHQYTDPGYRKILNGEIGRYEAIRFVEQTHIAKEAFTNGKSNWAFFMGKDTVCEGIACPEEIRGAIPSDFGRARGIAWYYLGGFGIVHKHDMDTDNIRIVKWDSAA